MRLIDADDLITYIKSTGLGTGIDTSQEDIVKAIEACPVVYDVNLVIEKLKEEKTIAYDDSIDEKIRVKLWNKAIGNAIKIVEGGIR